MADITRYPFVRHLRSTPTTYVEHVRNGAPAHAGAGLSFWFRPLSASISEVPVADQELPLLFHARTVDFQDVTVQATATFRVADPARAAGRIDFAIDPETGAWRGAPLHQVAGLLTEVVQQQAMATLAVLPLTDALVAGITAVRLAVEDAVGSDARLLETGLVVVSVRVVAIRPEPDVEKALQTPARERVQQEADRATYERRANAVERERTISENELQNRIELARREEQLVTQHGTNARRQAEEAALAQHIAVDSEAETTRTRATAEADRARTVGAAEAEVEAARLAALREAPDVVLWTQTLREVAPHLPAVDTLVVTPDLVSRALAALVERPAAS
jgi:regulator of protease activity HflC (stomatin/prohibitin superfamily)